MKPFFVYILKCKDNSYYIGQTDDLEKRMAEYNSRNNPAVGKSIFDRLPVILVFYEQFGSRSEAISAERKLKNPSSSLVLRQAQDSLPSGRTGL